MSYTIINVHPKKNKKEKERMDRENTIFVCEVFKKHNEQIKKQNSQNK